MEDRLEINDLYARYAHAFDSNSVEEWAHLFTPDGVFRLEGRGELVGRAALMEFALGRNGATPNISHHTTNVIADETSEGADGRAYAVAFRSDSDSIRMVNVGRYADKLVKYEGAWRFAERHFTSWLPPELLDAPVASL